MDLQIKKLELIEMLLRTKEESILIKIKAILENDFDNLNDEDYKIIDERREKHIKKESKSLTWNEAKKAILN